MDKKSIQQILNLVFNRIDYQTTCNGEVVNEYVYWKECKPSIVQGPNGPMLVGGGYLVVYRNNETLHTYQHPENIFR